MHPAQRRELAEPFKRDLGTLTSGGTYRLAKGPVSRMFLMLSCFVGKGEWLNSTLDHILTILQTVATILLEEPTFLASDDWCQLPWATFPKDDAHILIDTLLRIPGLLFLSNNTARKLREGNKAGAAEDEQQLHRVCQDIDMALCEWHDIARKSGYLGKLRDFTDAHHLPFSDIMEFRDVMQAQMMLFYWTGRLLAHDAAQRVEQARLAIGLEARKLQCDGRTLGDAADNICRSVAYCQKESNGMLGMQLSTLPLRTAEHFYQSTGRRRKRSGVAAAH